MPFPDDRDRKLRQDAEEATGLARSLGEWAATFNPDRRRVGLSPLTDEEQFEILELRRRSSQVLSSACVPTAAAAFGPSQSGKSLFIGQVLRAKDPDFSPLGRDETLGEPAYYPGLSFTEDLNPRCGSNEATSLVTRFTTADRMRADLPPRAPVMVLTLTRSDWLRVLARGFHAECFWEPAHRWSGDAIEALLRGLIKVAGMSGTAVDRDWRLDLADAFDAMRRQDQLRFEATGADLGGLLARYPLSARGYLALAARLFWEDWPGLTSLFGEVSDFIAGVAPPPDRSPGQAEGPARVDRPAILVHWAGVRFLLDSQRSAEVYNPESRVDSFHRLDWRDFRLVREQGWLVLDHRPGAPGPPVDVEVLQASLLEMVVPVLPTRIRDDWRAVLESIDLLDVPGMRAVREGAADGRRHEAPARRDQLEIVKRGKVLHLFDRYVEELQIQTLLILVRGGNLEVRGQIRAAVTSWGRARYPEGWGQVRDRHPALVVGLTGIDDEFRDGSYPSSSLYERRLEQLREVFSAIKADREGAGSSFDNVFPVRYPGSWDSDAGARAAGSPAKWDQARRAFLESGQVKQHVREPGRRWDAAMSDADGGLSLVAEALREATSAVGKQDQLASELAGLKGRLEALTRRWIVNPDVALERTKRRQSAETLLAWLAHPTLYHERIRILNRALTVQEGDVAPLADLEDSPATLAGEDPKERLNLSLDRFLDRWLAEQVPRRWEEAKGDDVGLGDGEFLGFAAYLAGYLRSPSIHERLYERLETVVLLQLINEDARRQARRRYTQMVLNDFLFNPGPVIPAWSDERSPSKWPYRLQEPFIRRWQQVLPIALADGAGQNSVIPPGNAELIELARRHGLTS